MWWGHVASFLRDKLDQAISIHGPGVITDVKDVMVLYDESTANHLVGFLLTSEAIFWRPAWWLLPKSKRYSDIVEVEVNQDTFHGTPSLRIDGETVFSGDLADAVAELIIKVIHKATASAQSNRT